MLMDSCWLCTSLSVTLLMSVEFWARLETDLPRFYPSCINLLSPVDIPITRETQRTLAYLEKLPQCDLWGNVPGRERTGLFPSSALVSKAPDPCLLPELGSPSSVPLGSSKWGYGYTLLPELIAFWKRQNRRGDFPYSHFSTEMYS